ncbi:PIN domain-containing protein [Haloplanus halophilus]|uniref:PIN domain-containing protein n=1 Tax=Haloplanus halophilus TaxID=2949993 RepID=UPI00203A4F3D|nr:PIN domain-containing protein [Haloplanus sp. GDY1]
MIVDTNYLGDLVERDPAALEVSRQADASAEPIRLPTAVIWELFYGLGKIEDADYATSLRRKYSAIIQGTVSVELDDHIARRAGTLRGKHKASDRLKDLDGADSVVAAHGLILNEPVVSNDGDFQDIEGLDVITY